MPKNGDVTYEIRSDDSHLDADLEKAGKKVEQSAKKSGENTVKAQQESSKKVVDAVKQANDEIAKSTEESQEKIGEGFEKSSKKSKSLEDSLQEVNKLLALNPDNVQLVAQKTDLLKRSIDKAESALKDLTKRQDEMKKALKNGSIGAEEYQEFQREVIASETNLRSLQDELKTTESTGKSSGGALKSALSGTAKAVGAAFVAVGSAAVAVGAKAVNLATDMDKAMNQYIASTGKGKDETERYQKVLEGIYTNNYGESFEDIANAMSQVEKQLGSMDDASLQEVTESAFALRDVFAYDVSESTRAAKALMDNFGVSGEEAMGLIAAGAQNGLDYSGELLDSISEYSVQFGKVGLDADDMFKIFQKGAESGAWNLDKIGDAVKEMSIRVIDGSDTTAEGFELIGLNADEMAEKFAAGGDSAKEAFEQTIDALAGMEDPLAQNTAGVDLFGTMWEDLGPGVVEQLASISEGAYDTAGAMEGIKEVKYDDLGSMMETLGRQVEMLIMPLGESLMPILQDLLENVFPILEEMLPPLMELIGQAIEQMAPVVQELLPVLVQLFNDLLPPLMQLIQELLPIFTQLFTDLMPIISQIIQALLPPLVEFLNLLLPPIMELISELLPPLLGLFDSLMPIFQLALDLLAPLIGLFTGLIDPVVSLINDAVAPLIETFTDLLTGAIEPLMPVIETLAGIVTDVLGDAFEGLKPVIDTITEIFQGLLDFITGIFTGNWEQAWNGIVSVFKGIINAVPAAVEWVINGAIGLINGIIRGINSVGQHVGITLGEIPEVSLPRLKTGIDFVPDDLYPAYLDRGERVLTQTENEIYTELGGIQGLESAMSVFLSGGALDADDIGANVAKALKDAGFIPGSGQLKSVMQINGREAAIVLAPYISEEVRFRD